MRAAARSTSSAVRDGVQLDLAHGEAGVREAGRLVGQRAVRDENAVEAAEGASARSTRPCRAARIHRVEALGRDLRRAAHAQVLRARGEQRLRARGEVEARAARGPQARGGFRDRRGGAHDEDPHRAPSSGRGSAFRGGRVRSPVDPARAWADPGDWANTHRPGNARAASSAVAKSTSRRKPE
jgi:hypothetical protein